MQGVKSDKVDRNVTGNGNKIVQKSEARSLQCLYLECSLINPRVVLLPVPPSFTLLLFTGTHSVFLVFVSPNSHSNPSMLESSPTLRNFLLLPVLLKNLYPPFLTGASPFLASSPSLYPLCLAHYPLKLHYSSHLSLQLLRCSLFSKKVSFNNHHGKVVMSLPHVSATCSLWKPSPLLNKMPSSFRVAKERSCHALRPTPRV